MSRVPDSKMEEAFRDPAVPDGAGSMGDAWRSGDNPGGGGGGGEPDTAGTIYYAMCQDCPGDGVRGGWVGPDRKRREDAQADADGHNQSHPGHGAIVYG